MVNLEFEEMKAQRCTPNGNLDFCAKDISIRKMMVKTQIKLDE